MSWSYRRGDYNHAPYSSTPENDVTDALKAEYHAGRLHECVWTDMTLVFSEFKPRPLVAEWDEDLHCSNMPSPYTRPDQWFPLAVVPVYIDGPAHWESKRVEKNDMNVNAAWKQVGVKPLRFPIKGSRLPQYKLREIVDKIVTEVNR